MAPPQPGMFPVPAHKSRAGNITDDANYAYLAGPSKSSDESKKDRKRKEAAGRLTKEMAERRDEITLTAHSFATDTIRQLNAATQILALQPQASDLYNLRLYPLSLERAALLAMLAVEERHARDGIETAYNEERARVEEEWKKGRERVRDRLLEGIEQRRRRAREEKDGDGTADTTVDSQARPHITRKLRNKLSSPPPPVLPFPPAPPPGGAITSGVTISGPLTNPLSLNVDELPSPFPLPLIAAATATGPSSGGAGTSASAAPNGRRRAKGGGGQREMVGGLGKSLMALTQCKESEIEADLGDIRRGNKRRRR